MGCCESSPKDTIQLSTITNPYCASSSLPLTPAECMVLQQVLAKIPVHCRERIASLPARQFLDAYQNHLIAKYHFKRNEFDLAIFSEREAVKCLQTLLPQHEDHIIFTDMYNLLTMCVVPIGLISPAIEGCQLVLDILFKHTPTDYTAISEQYFQMSILYKVSQELRMAVAYLTKAIETARLSNEPDQERIHKLKADRQLMINQIVANESIFTVREIKPNPDETEEDYRSRALAEVYGQNPKHGTLPHDLPEIERLPDKQTESQVTDEILNEVLNHLKKHLYSEEALYWFKSGAFMTQSLAVDFKLDHMKTNPLSPAIIEAALTMIIDRMNDEHMSNNEQYIALKQAPLKISYTDNSFMHTKGVRVFVYETNKQQSENK